ncbi:hypothetical protein VTL71DRAFT_2434 [Oculimacula yallundae]|uniref:F-box domain-containing protein n=1 Tax=Oculimacula yallundae TaxID=86028 RepID=A0ABR4C8T6_9HELO
MPQPLALTPALPSELLTYILSHQTYPTTLIICQSRANFLSSLQRCMPNTVQRQPPLYNEQSSSVSRENAEAKTQQAPKAPQEAESQAEPNPEPNKHPLLTPTLHQILTSRSINLVFIPTLSHLRAYLAIFPIEDKQAGDKSARVAPQRQFEKKGNRVPLLVVYGLVGLHRDTSEWSAQGVGDSVAALVEAGWRARRGVVSLEEREWDGGADGVGDGDEGVEGGREKRTGWDERLPILNGSVKRVGLESEDGGWSGRTVEVGRVLGRWFRFERGEWDQVTV